jgi:putative MATE family efflux protein
MLKSLAPSPRRDRVIVKLAGPIVGGMLSQTLVNLVDTAMVGRLGADALAAVGLGSVATWLSVSILLGIGSATQALVARRIGEGRPEAAGRVLDNALVLAGSTGLVMGVLIYTLTPLLMSVLASSARVEVLGADYLTMRTIGFPFVVVNFAFRGFYHGAGDTRTHLKAILVVHSLNIVLDALLIFGLLGFPRMGPGGAGLATALGLAGGTLYYALWATRRTRIRARYGALRWTSLCRETCRGLLAIQIPNGLQNLANALGFMTLYWMMARIDTLSVAINSLLMNVNSVFYLPAYGLGLASATLVGQALGRGEPAEAEAWGWESVRLACYVLTAAGLLLALVPGPALRVFTDDARVVEAGRLALQITALGQFATAITMVLSNVLISAGNARYVAAVNVLVTYALVLPATYGLAVLLGGGVTLAWLLQGGGRLLAGGALVLRFRAGGWKSSKL